MLVVHSFNSLTMVECLELMKSAQEFDVLWCTISDHPMHLSHSRAIAAELFPERKLLRCTP